MINTQKIQEKIEEILTLRVKLANAKKELRLIPDGYIYIIAHHGMILDSNCVNYNTAIEEMEVWSNDEMVQTVTLWTNNPQAHSYEQVSYYYFVKFASISDLQNLYEGKG